MQTQSFLSSSMIGGLAAGMVVALSSAVAAEEKAETQTSGLFEPRQIVFPLVDAKHGRRLFVTKGCVLCHAVNGAGGIAAPALDADGGSEQLDLMDFVVRMWNGAQAMIELQAFELGYQIELTGEEIGDLAAFAASPEAQYGFSMADIPDAMHSWIIEKPYWMGDGWPESFEEEYHENGLPLDYN
ncbi:MAG: cytochrome c [Alphaproteobacteria bacterium]|nr:cytochrome c [Alphaproteobacteria bacterium]